MAGSRRRRLITGMPSSGREVKVSDAIHNEQVKLTATIMNNVGAGFFLIGVVTPFLHVDPSAGSIALAIIAGGLGTLFHRFARDYLEGMRI
jgi:hypothetical protein